MAVAHDASSESHTGTTGSASEASFTWNHDPVGTPRGVLIFTFDTDSATHAPQSVTYDGVTVPAVTGGLAADTANEPGSTKAWFLGASVPTTDPAAVVVTRTNNANVCYAICITVTASGDTAVGTPVLLQENQDWAEKNCDDGSPGSNSVRYAGGYSGRATIPPAGANSTLLQNINMAARSAGAVRETTAGQGSRPVGFVTTGSVDDAAGVHLAVKETSSTPVSVALPVAGLAFDAPGVVTQIETEISPAPADFSFNAPTLAVTTGTPVAVSLPVADLAFDAPGLAVDREVQIFPAPAGFALEAPPGLVGGGPSIAASVDLPVADFSFGVPDLTVTRSVEAFIYPGDFDFDAPVLAVTVPLQVVALLGAIPLIPYEPHIHGVHRRRFFMPRASATEKVPANERLEFVGTPVPSNRYRHMLRYPVGEDIIIAGVTYRGGRWNGPLSDAEADAITAAGLGDRVVSLADDEPLPLGY